MNSGTNRPRDIVQVAQDRVDEIFSEPPRPIVPLTGAEIIGNAGTLGNARSSPAFASNGAAEQVARRPTIAFVADNLSHDLEGARVNALPSAQGRDAERAANFAQVGALAGEAVMKQADAAADRIVAAGLEAMALGNRIRDVADDLAEGLRTRAENLEQTIKTFSDVALQLQGLAARQQALLQNFDPPGPKVQ